MSKNDRLRLSDLDADTDQIKEKMDEDNQSKMVIESQIAALDKQRSAIFKEIIVHFSKFVHEKTTIEKLSFSPILEQHRLEALKKRKIKKHQTVKEPSSNKKNQKPPSSRSIS